MGDTDRPADTPAPHWLGLRTMLLRQRTVHLVGAPADTDEHPELRFAITHQPPPASGIAVTLDDVCDLADVYDLCQRVAAACLGDDDQVNFARAASSTEAAR